MPTKTMPCRPKAQSSKKTNASHPLSNTSLKTNPGPATPWWLPTTKSGDLKKKLSRDEKLVILDPDAPKKLTRKRLKAFGELFAWRSSGAIITRGSAEPTNWTALPGGIQPDHIARHLLADRVPHLGAKCLGVRSFRRTRWFCIDVDADEATKLTRQLANSPLDDEEKATCVRDIQARRRIKGHQPTRAPFTERCRRVEDFLKATGVDPHDRRQVMIQPTPSGGRHYYLFTQESHPPDFLKGLAKDFGIREAKGEYEFFPAETHALRLPFGFIPDQKHDPKAWIRFTDDYLSRRIVRHRMQDLFNSLHETIRSRPKAKAEAKTKTTSRRTPAGKPSASPPTSPLSYLGIPKRDRTNTELPTDRQQRFGAIMAKQTHTQQDVQELLALGIRQPGTRTAVLKILAAHLIWFRKLTVEEATEFLNTWANDPAHESNDIRADQTNGTDKVARQIALMCRWYAEHQKQTPHPAGSTSDTRPNFAVAELLALRDHVRSLPDDEQTNQAHFLLSFLSYAKQHGAPNLENTGWTAAPAIAKVVRKWPGCNHQHYKTRMAHAEAASLFKMVREKWQNPNGKGRARTYELNVPIVAPEDWRLDYEAALLILIAEQIQDHLPAAANITTTDERATGTQNKESNPSDEPKQPSEPCSKYCSEFRSETTQPTPVRSAGAGGDLDPRPRQRDPQPAPAFRLPHQAAGTMRTTRRYLGQPLPDNPRWQPADPTAAKFMNAEDKAFTTLGILPIETDLQAGDYRISGILHIEDNKPVDRRWLTGVHGPLLRDGRNALGKDHADGRIEDLRRISQRPKATGQISARR